MLDPRVYRTGLIVAALGLVVLAFSLSNQQGALNPTLAPDAFNASNVFTTMNALAQQYPNRRPASTDDSNVATVVSNKLSSYGFAPTTSTFDGRTVDGTVPLENVVGTRQGDQPGSIVIVASRDALAPPSLAALSGTAMLVELARDLQGETLNRTVVLASTSGSQGTAGAIQLAHNLPGPIDAVIVLGDLASSHVQTPVVIPWSMRHVVAPTMLRNTVGSSLGAQTPWSGGGVGLGGQFAHLAFPFTLGQQAPFGSLGIPAVELTVSGEQGPAPDATIGTPGQAIAQLNEIGRGVLETISALDNGPTVPAPSSYLLLDGKVVPGWAIALFDLALLVPVLMTTIDGVARARRRGHVIWRSLTVMLAASAPFLAAVLVVLAARVLGVISIAPPGPVVAGAVPLHGSGIAVLAVAVLAMLLAGAGVVMAARRLPSVRAARRNAARRDADGDASARNATKPTNSSDGAVAALLMVMCAVTFAIWLENPWAALLLIPAVHLWMWAVSSDLPFPRALRLGLVALGAVPVALVIVYYANTYGYGPMGVIWQATLLLAGHAVSVLAAFEWCVVLGCLAGATTLALLAGRGSKVAPVPITVRGPATYAGPGSLGGTKSAIRR
jgi:hypothetical protein